ncbi:MAG: SCP2 sterol-binding domain-containing protein [Anaerolineae bacterium]|nr:SCP2 sterol-binding domain-containing protein [Anaerolineae bacterium]
MAGFNVQGILNRIGGIDPSKIEGITGVFLFDISGEGGGTWTVSIADGKIDVAEGRVGTPDLSVSMSAQDFVALSNGELNAVSAFMQGKIKIQGDMSMAMRLQSILS